MRDEETIAAALTAAETGHLVLSTLHSASAAMAIDRIIDVFPGHKQPQVRLQLAGVLRAVVTQVLLPSTQLGRVPAFEKMIVTAAVGSQIREGRAHQIANQIQTGRAEGMMSLDQSLLALLRAGKVSVEAAMAVAPDPDGPAPGDASVMRGEAGTVLRGAGAWRSGRWRSCTTRAWAFICDDAYISFRYARNLAEHGTLAFNLVAPRELIEGYTNFLWVLLLALGDAAGVAPEVLAPWLTQAACWRALAMACWLLRGLRGGWIALVPALLLACSPEFMVWGRAGSRRRWGRRCAWRRWPRRRAGAGERRGLVTRAGRPDAPGRAAADRPVLWDMADRTWPKRLARLAPTAAGAGRWRRAVAAAPAVAAHTYGSWLPNTWVIKQFGGLLRGATGSGTSRLGARRSG
jgi:hypothetical protein